MDKSIKFKIKARDEKEIYEQIKKLEEIAEKNNIPHLNLEVELISDEYKCWYK